MSLSDPPYVVMVNSAGHIKVGTPGGLAPIAEHMRNGYRTVILDWEGIHTQSARVREAWIEHMKTHTRLVVLRGGPFDGTWYDLDGIWWVTAGDRAVAPHEVPTHLVVADDHHFDRTGDFEIRDQDGMPARVYALRAS